MTKRLNNKKNENNNKRNYNNKSTINYNNNPRNKFKKKFNDKVANKFNSNNNINKNSNKIMTKRLNNKKNENNNKRNYNNKSTINYNNNPRNKFKKKFNDKVVNKFSSYNNNNKSKTKHVTNFKNKKSNKFFNKRQNTFYLENKKKISFENKLQNKLENWLKNIRFHGFSNERWNKFLLKRRINSEKKSKLKILFHYKNHYENSNKENFGRTDIFSVSPHILNKKVLPHRIFSFFFKKRFNSNIYNKLKLIRTTRLNFDKNFKTFFFTKQSCYTPKYKRKQILANMFYFVARNRFPYSPVVFFENKAILVKKIKKVSKTYQHFARHYLSLKNLTKFWSNSLRFKKNIKYFYAFKCYNNLFKTRFISYKSKKFSPEIVFNYKKNFKNAAFKKSRNIAYTTRKNISINSEKYVNRIEQLKLKKNDFDAKPISVKTGKKIHPFFSFFQNWHFLNNKSGEQIDDKQLYLEKIVMSRNNGSDSMSVFNRKLIEISGLFKRKRKFSKIFTIIFDSSDFNWNKNKPISSETKILENLVMKKYSGSDSMSVFNRKLIEISRLFKRDRIFPKIFLYAFGFTASKNFTPPDDLTIQLEEIIYDKYSGSDPLSIFTLRLVELSGLFRKKRVFSNFFLNVFGVKKIDLEKESPDYKQYKIEKIIMKKYSGSDSMSVFNRKLISISKLFKRPRTFSKNFLIAFNCDDFHLNLKPKNPDMENLKELIMKKYSGSDSMSVFNRKLIEISGLFKRDRIFSDFFLAVFGAKSFKRGAKRNVLDKWIKLEKIVMNRNSGSDSMSVFNRKLIEISGIFRINKEISSFFLFFYGQPLFFKNTEYLRSVLLSEKIFVKTFKNEIINNFKKLNSTTNLKKIFFDYKKKIKLKSFVFDKKIVKKNKLFLPFNSYYKRNHFKNFFFLNSFLKQYSNKSFIEISNNKKLFSAISYARSNTADFSWRSNSSLGYKLTMIDKIFLSKKNTEIKKNVLKTINFFSNNKLNMNFYFNSFNFSNKILLFKDYFKKLGFINVRKRLNLIISNKFNFLNIFGVMNKFKKKYLYYLKYKNCRDIPLVATSCVNNFFAPAKKGNVSSLKFRQKISRKKLLALSFKKDKFKFKTLKLKHDKNNFFKKFLPTKSLLEKNSEIKRVINYLDDVFNNKMRMSRIPNIFDFTISELKDLSEKSNIDDKKERSYWFLRRINYINKVESLNFSNKILPINEFDRFLIKNKTVSNDFKRYFFLKKLKKSVNYKKFENSRWNFLIKQKKKFLYKQYFKILAKFSVVDPFPRDRFYKKFNRITEYINFNNFKTRSFISDGFFSKKFKKIVKSKLINIEHEDKTVKEQLDETEKQLYNLMADKITSIANKRIKFQYHYKASYLKKTNSKFYFNSNFKRNFILKKKFGAARSFRTVDSAKIGWLFPSRRVYSFFFKSYSENKKAGLYRHVLKEIYKNNSLQKNDTLYNFSNKNNFFLNKKNFTIKKLKKIKKKFFKTTKINNVIKKKFFKKKFNDFSVFNISLIKLQNKKLKRYFRYKNLVFNHIFSKRHKLFLRRPLNHLKKVKYKHYDWFAHDVLPEGEDLGFFLRLPSLIEEKHSIFSDFKNGLNSEPLCQDDDDDDNSGFKKLSNKNKNKFKRYHKNFFRNVRRANRNLGIRNRWLNHKRPKNVKKKFAERRILIDKFSAKKTVIPKIKFEKWTRNKKRKTASYGEFSTGPKLIKYFLSNFRYIRKINEFFSFKKILKHAKKFETKEKNVILKVLRCNIFSKKNLFYWIPRRTKKFRNFGKVKWFAKQRLYKKRNWRYFNPKKPFSSDFFKKRHPTFKVIKLYKRKGVKFKIKNFCKKKINKPKISIKKIFRINSTKIYKKRLIRSQILKKKFIIYYKKTSIFNNNYFYAKNIQNIFKKNRLFKQTVNLAMKELFYAKGSYFKNFWIQKAYFSYISARLRLKSKHFYNASKIKAFVFDLFVFVIRKKRFLLKWKKKRFKLIFSKNKQYDRYFWVLLIRKKWEYRIALFDYKNMMLLHFNFLSLGIKFSKKVRINFYRVWHKMIFKFYEACLKNKIFHFDQIRYYKRNRRKNKIKKSWILMFTRQYRKALMHDFAGKVKKINKISFSKKTTKNKKMKR